MRDETSPAGRALALWTGRVAPEWTDYNGHMTEHRYLQVFGESTDAFLRHIGVDLDRAAEGTFYTLESHLRHVHECHPGTSLATTTEVLGHDDKRLHLFHRLTERDTGRLLATGEHLCIHVAQSRACPASCALAEKIASVFRAQAGLPSPERVGSVLRGPLANRRPG